MSLSTAERKAERDAARARGEAVESDDEEEAAAAKRAARRAAAVLALEAVDDDDLGLDVDKDEDDAAVGGDDDAEALLEELKQDGLAETEVTTNAAADNEPVGK